MRQLDLIQLNPTRYHDPVTMQREYHAWFNGNVARKTEFTDRVSFLRTAAIVRFLLLWFLCDLMEDLKIIKSGKKLITTVTMD